MLCMTVQRLPWLTFIASIPLLSPVLLPFSSILFLLRRPRLLGLCIIPAVINVLLFVGILWGFSEWITGPLAGPPAPPNDKLMELWRAVGQVILTLVALVLASVSVYALAIPIGAPFMDEVSARIEEELLADHPDLIARIPLMEGIRHALFEALRRVVWQIPAAVFIFILGFVPIIGAPIAFFLGWFYASLFFLVDAFSYAMDRRKMTFRAKLRWLNAHRRDWLGMGTSIAVLLLIPCNVFWLPTLASVAATRVWCARLRKGRVADPG